MDPAHAFIVMEEVEVSQRRCYAQMLGRYIFLFFTVWAQHCVATSLSLSRSTMCERMHASLCDLRKRVAVTPFASRFPLSLSRRLT